MQGHSSIEAYEHIQFDFLGYTFRPRRSRDRYGRVFINFTPAISQVAAKAMRQKVRGWRLQLKSEKSISRFLADVRTGDPGMDELLLSISSLGLWRVTRPINVRWSGGPCGNSRSCEVTNAGRYTGSRASHGTAQPVSSLACQSS